MTRLRNLGERLWTTFWFLPSLMTLAAVALSFGVIAVDNRVQSKVLREFSPYWWLYTGGAEGARTLLSSVAGSMMTVVGVAFSITIVSLQLASSQFGPRLLRNFMRDTGNQIVLGTFVATFMYCLLVLRTVRGEDGIDDTFVPHVAVTVGVMLAACSVAVLIYFIHHSAAAIQADNVVATVSADLDTTIDRLFPEPVGRPAGAPTNAGLPEDFDTQAVPVPAPRTGYLQTVDPDQLMRMAQHHDLVLRLSVRPGQFVLGGTPVALAWPPSRATEQITRAAARAFTIGTQRTPSQDVEFGIWQLVEIAVRALSPGINDPHTANACVDRLAATLARIGPRPLPESRRCDEDGRLRVVADPVSKQSVVDAAFDEVRQAAARSVSVTIRLLEAIRIVAPHADGEMRRALQAQASMIHHQSDAMAIDPRDLDDINARYSAAMAVLAPPVPRSVRTA
jgi:uncharacterized membrane protein